MVKLTTEKCNKDLCKQVMSHLKYNDFKTYLNNFVEKANIQNFGYETGTNSLDQMYPFEACAYYVSRYANVNI